MNTSKVYVLMTSWNPVGYGHDEASVKAVFVSKAKAEHQKNILEEENVQDIQNGYDYDFRVWIEEHHFADQTPHPVVANVTAELQDR